MELLYKNGGVRGLQAQKAGICRLRAATVVLLTSANYFKELSAYAGFRQVAALVGKTLSSPRREVLSQPLRHRLRLNRDTADCRASDLTVPRGFSGLCASPVPILTRTWLAPPCLRRRLDDISYLQPVSRETKLLQFLNRGWGRPVLEARVLSSHENHQVVAVAQSFYATVARVVQPFNCGRYIDWSPAC